MAQPASFSSWERNQISSSRSRLSQHLQDLLAAGPTLQQPTGFFNKRERDILIWSHDPRRSRDLTISLAKVEIRTHSNRKKKVKHVKLSFFYAFLNL